MFFICVILLVVSVKYSLFCRLNFMFFYLKKRSNIYFILGGFENEMGVEREMLSG